MMIEAGTTTDESGEPAALLADLHETPSLGERYRSWKLYAREKPGLTQAEVAMMLSRPMDANEAAAALAGRFPGCPFSLGEVHSILVSIGGTIDSRRRCRIEGRIDGIAVEAESPHWEGALAAIVGNTEQRRDVPGTAPSTDQPERRG